MRSTIKLFDLAGGPPGGIPEMFDRAGGTFMAPDGMDSPTFVASSVVNQMRVQQGLNPPLRMAVLDSGVIRQHPLIAPRLRGAIDLTGGGDPEDRVGHGTAVTLILLKAYPNAELYVAKITNDMSNGDENALIRGIQWAGEQNVDAANLSCGVERFWCRGKCRVCTSVKALADRGVAVTCAGGNSTDKVCCPATVGVRGYRSVCAVCFSKSGQDIIVTITQPYLPSRFVTYQQREADTRHQSQCSSEPARQLDALIATARLQATAGGHAEAAETLASAFSMSRDLKDMRYMDEIVQARVGCNLAAKRVAAAQTALDEGASFLSHPGIAAGLVLQIRAAGNDGSI